MSEIPTQLADLALSGQRSLVRREFDSLEALALALIAAEVQWREGRKVALNEAAKLVKADAREQIGEYQAAVGNYPPWAPLAESTENEKARLGAPPDAPLERFGDLKKSFRSELEGDNAVIIGSTDPVMTYHEFGTSKMPPRPVLGPALLKSMPKIEALLGSAIVAVICGQRMGYRFNSQFGVGDSADEG